MLGFNMGTGLAGIIALVLVIWVIYDVLANNRRASTVMKIVWIVCAIVFSWTVVVVPA